MTDKIKKLEAEFNKNLPTIEQAEPGKGKPRSFNGAAFLKAAKDLKKVIDANDRKEILGK